MRPNSTHSKSTAHRTQQACYCTSSLFFSAACEEGEDAKGKAASEDFCREPRRRQWDTKRETKSKGRAGVNQTCGSLKQRKEGRKNVKDMKREKHKRLMGNAITEQWGHTRASQKFEHVI